MRIRRICAARHRRRKLFAKSFTPAPAICGPRTASTWDEKARFTMPGMSQSRMRTARLSQPLKVSVKQTLDLGHPLICLSGDHSVTYPTIKAFHSKYPDLTILHFDSHPDLYDELDGNRLSHACPFARIMEERFARRLVQVGVRTINSHQLAQASKFGVEVITMRNLERFAALEFEGPLFHFAGRGRTRSGIRAGNLALRARRDVGA